MSSLVGTGNIIWSGAYIVISTVGFVVLVALLNVFYINRYNIKYWWYKGLLFIICMAVSVILFGGFVIVLWHLWDIKTGKNTDDKNKISGLQPEESNAYKNPSHEDFVNTIKYGQRPNFKGTCLQLIIDMARWAGCVTGQDKSFFSTGQVGSTANILMSIFFKLLKIFNASIIIANLYYYSNSLHQLYALKIDFERLPTLIVPVLMF